MSFSTHRTACCQKFTDFVLKDVKKFFCHLMLFFFFASSVIHPIIYKKKNCSGLVHMILNNLAKLLLTYYINACNICLQSCCSRQFFVQAYALLSSIKPGVCCDLLTSKMTKWAGAAQRCCHVTASAQPTWGTVTSGRRGRETARASDCVNCHSRICQSPPITSPNGV